MQIHIFPKDFGHFTSPDGTILASKINGAQKMSPLGDPKNAKYPLRLLLARVGDMRGAVPEPTLSRPCAWRPPKSPKFIFLPILEGFRTDFGRILEDFGTILVDFGLIFDWFFKIFEDFWIDFGVVFRTSSHHIFRTFFLKPGTFLTNFVGWAGGVAPWRIEFLSVLCVFLP